MSSKREKFYTLCKKLWTAGSAAALATAFFISGSQFTSVAHAQETWDGKDYKYESTDNITLSGKTINGDTAFIKSDKNVNLTNNSDIKAVSGYMYASEALSINNSKVTQSYTGFLDGSTLTIENQSIVKQGLGGRITGQTWAKINNASVQQGSGGLVEAILNGLTIENNARVTQGEDGTIIAHQAVVIDTGAIVEQGNNSTTGSGTSSVSVIGGGKLIQGDGSSVTTAAGKDIIVNNGNLSQGLTSEILAGGALNFSGGSKIDQLANGLIKSGTGYGITINNTAVKQGDLSQLISGGTLTLQNGASVTQGNGGKIGGGNSSDVEINGATIRQGDNSSLTSNRNLTLTGNSTIIQEDGSKVTANGTLSATGSAIHQENNGEISASTVTLSNMSVSQEDNGLLTSNTTMSITGGTIHQNDNGSIHGNTSVTMSGANVNQDEDGRITSDGTMSITAGTINQKYGLSVITSSGDMTVNGATINQSVKMNGTGGINARLGSGGLLKIEGTSKITQGGGGRLSGDAGVLIGSGAVVVQGDSSAITTLAGNDITIGGTVIQGRDSDIVTSGSGKLNLLGGAKITQDERGRIINADHANVTLDGIILQQGNNSIFRTGGDLTIKNTGTRVENFQQGSNSLLSAETVTLDNAAISLGTGSEIRLGYLNAHTEKEKEDANVQLTVTNGSLLWNRGGGMLSIGSEVGGITDVSAFNKIAIGANSEILSSGLLTLNNDWIEIAATGKLASTGVIILANESKMYGNGSIAASQGLIVTDGSILSPGGNHGKGIGTLHVYGPLMITPSGIVEIQVAASGNDLIVVEDGDALIGGLLRMSGDINEDAVYTILQTDGTIGGLFNFDEAFFVADQWVVEEDGWQYLQVGGVQEKDTHFAGRAKTFNQKAAGRILDKIGTSGGWWDAKTYINDLGQADFLSALDMISGGIKANSLTLYRENPWRSAADQFGWNPCGQILLGNQNRFCSNPCPTRAVWATPYYTESDYRSDGNAGAYSVHSVGFQAGINQKIDQKTAVGVFFGYGRPEMKQGWDNVDMDDFTIGLTAGGMITSKLEMKAVVAGGFQNYSMRRYMNPQLLGTVGNTNPMLSSDFDGNTLFASIELARPVYLNTGALIRPLVAFESENVWQQGFREQGGSIYALEFDKVYNDRTFVRTGLDAEIGARSFTLLGRAFYSHQLGGSAYSRNDIRFLGGKNGFEQVRGVDLERNFATLGAGGKFNLNPRKTQTIAGNYDATISAKSTSHAIYASFTQLF